MNHEDAVNLVGRRNFSRRGALQVGLAGAASLALSRAAAGDETQGKPRSKDQPAAQPEKATGGVEKGAIDAHVHVWTPDLNRYPLAKGFTVADMKPPSFTPEQLFAHARPCGVDRVVLIQMSFYGFDNSYMLDCMREYPGTFSGVAVIDENASQPEVTMRDLARQKVRGFRIYPDKQKPQAWIATPGMARMWKCGGEDGLAMCALINPDTLPLVDEMCKKFPDTPVVVDHFGRIGMDGTIHDRDVDNLCRLARHKQTSVKISAYYALGKKTPPYTDMGPLVRRLLDAFGRERLMWASDCPFQVDPGHNYRDSIELVRTRLDFLSPSDRSWLLAKTAQRVFFS